MLDSAWTSPSVSTLWYLVNLTVRIALTCHCRQQHTFCVRPLRNWMVLMVMMTLMARNRNFWRPLNINDFMDTTITLLLHHFPSLSEDFLQITLILEGVWTLCKISRVSCWLDLIVWIHYSFNPGSNPQYPPVHDWVNLVCFQQDLLRRSWISTSLSFRT